MDALCHHSVPRVVSEDEEEDEDDEELALGEEDVAVVRCDMIEHFGELEPRSQLA